MTNPSTSQILTTTLNNYKKSITDNILNNHPLFSKLQQKGNVIKESGGASFVEKISYASNGTVQSQGEYDTFNTTPQDVLTEALFTQKMITGTLTLTGLESKRNAGKERIVPLMDAKMKVLQASLQNELGSQVYGDGTGSNGKDIGGLQLLIADDPTSGTVGGIDRATYPFWRNQLYDFSVEGPTASATTIQAAMDALYLRCQVQAGESPDLIAADSVYFTYYNSALVTIQRITTDARAASGFSALAYRGAEVFYDNECPASHMYFINTKHVFLKYLGDALFEVGEASKPVNQDSSIMPLIFVGNMTIDNSRVHGVIHA